MTTQQELFIGILKMEQAWEDTWQQVLDGMKVQKGNTHDQNLKR